MGTAGGNAVFNGSASAWAAGWCPSPVSFLPILGMALYLCCFSAGFGPMPWTINAEIYPNWARSTGPSLARFCLPGEEGVTLKGRPLPRLLTGRGTSSSPSPSSP